MTLLLLLVILVAFAWWHAIKPLPRGLSVQGSPHPIEPGRILFLSDLTSLDSSGQRVCRHQIFSTLFELIDNAQRYILLDVFLFNDQPGKKQPADGRPLAGELAARLIARKQQCPDLRIDIITDPINRAYDGAPAPPLDELKEAGIYIITTETDALRDSNPLYSGLWRLLLRWIPAAGKICPHPFARDAGKISPNGWLRLLNFKANHRKVALVDQADGFSVLVTSANPHGGSSLHSNAALLIRDDKLARDLYSSELAVARLSQRPLSPLPQPEQSPRPAPSAAAPLTVRLITEGGIGVSVCAALNGTARGDRICLAMFYLADRKVIRGLLAAAARGVTVEIILDPNRDAFGYRKNGVPNQPVAAELVAASAGVITVRWYLTHGEQFHTKLLFIESRGDRADLVLGSANLTRRNLRDYNLETDLHVSGPRTAPVFSEVRGYWRKIWQNADARYTAPYADYADPGRFKKWQYQLQERFGLGTF